MALDVKPLNIQLEFKVHDVTGRVDFTQEKMSMRAAFMALFIATSAPAFANQGDTSVPATSAQASQQSVQTAKADDSADKKICKRVDATESRLNAKKVCLTAQQWKQRDEENASSW